MGRMALVIYYGLMARFWLQDFPMGQKSIPLRKHKWELSFLAVKDAIARGLSKVVFLLDALELIQTINGKCDWEIDSIL